MIRANRVVYDVFFGIFKTEILPKISPVNIVGVPIRYVHFLAAQARIAAEELNPGAG